MSWTMYTGLAAREYGSESHANFAWLPRGFHLLSPSVGMRPTRLPSRADPHECRVPQGLLAQ
jgi:hypothetical protein